MFKNNDIEIINSLYFGFRVYIFELFRFKLSQLD